MNSDKKLFASFNLKMIDVFLLLSLAILIFTRYGGLLASAYQNLYQSLLHSGSFAKDIFVQNTYYMKSSLVFDLVAWTGISPDNDYVGFALHVCFSLIALTYAFKIIRDFTPIKGLTYQLMALLSLATIDHFLLIDTFPSIIYYGYGFTTGYGHALMFPLIYYALSSRVFHVAILSTLIFTISAKAGLFPISVSWAYLFLFHWREQRYKLLSVLVPLITVYVMSRGVPLPDDFDLRFLMLENAVDRSQEENVLHLQPRIFLTLLFSSIPIYFLLLQDRAVRFFLPQGRDGQALGEIKNYFYIVFVFSVLLIIGGWLYGRYLYEVYPDPRLIMLSTPRSLALYQWSFALLLIIRMLQSNVHSIVKVAFLAGMIYFDFKYNSYKPVELAVVLWSFVGLAIGFHILHQQKVQVAENIGAFLQKIKIRDSFIFFLFVLLSLPNLILSFNVYTAKHYSPTQHRLISKWYSATAHVPEIEKAAISLRTCDDFLLLGLLKSTKDESIIFNTYVNYLAMKSKYLGDEFSLVFQPELYELAQDRVRFVNKVIQEIVQNKTLDPSAVKRFKQDGVNILTYLDPAQYSFPGSTVESVGDGVWLVRYDKIPLVCRDE